MKDRIITIEITLSELSSLTDAVDMYRNTLYEMEIEFDPDNIDDAEQGKLKALDDVYSTLVIKSVENNMLN